MSQALLLGMLFLMVGVKGKTLIFAPTFILGKYWQIESQEVSSSPISCIIKCERTKCPGVAFDRKARLCLIGSIQDNPSNDILGQIEIWKDQPISEYIRDPSAPVMRLPKTKLCSQLPTWNKQPNGKAYKLYSKRQLKTSHASQCRAEGGQLAIILTRADEDAVFKVAGNVEAWVGITNHAQRSCYNEQCNPMFTWDDGTQFQYDNSVYARAFDGISGHGCLRTSQGIFNDRDCADASKGGLCEIVCD